MENKRIAQLFEDLYDGAPWIDVTVVGTLRKLSAEQAAAKALPACNSIWEIVNHMIRWRENVFQRVQGKIITTPANNYIEPVADPSPEAWLKTLETFQQTQTDWLRFLQNFADDNFQSIYPPNGMTYYEHIHGLLQHDAYHLGQIVLLSKFVEPKP